MKLEFDIIQVGSSIVNNALTTTIFIVKIHKQLSNLRLLFLSSYLLKKIFLF